MEPLNQDHEDSAGAAGACLELPQVNESPAEGTGSLPGCQPGAAGNPLDVELQPVNSSIG